MSRRVLKTTLVLTVPIVLLSTPVLVLCVFIPFVGFLALPTLLATSVYLLYGTTWLCYAFLSPQARLPYSPKRCYKICREAARWLYEAYRLNAPALAMDWSYRRVMVLGSKSRDHIIKENIPYGSYKGNKKLDVYLPPSNARQYEASADQVDNQDGGDSVAPDEPAPVVILILAGGWGVFSDKRYFVQIALTLRKKGMMVVVPDITLYPEGKAVDMVADIRRVLAWTARNASEYGGDPNSIYLMGHGSGAHLALLTVVQEAVVRSRDAFWFSAYAKEAKEVRTKAKSPAFEDQDELDHDEDEHFPEQRLTAGAGGGENIEVSAGIRRLEIWGGESVQIPKIKAMVLMGCISDVIKHTRNEFKNGLEQISPLRKALGPSHAQCLMASPSHLLFGAKQIINPKNLPQHVLLIHGGQDHSVPIVQSVLLKTLLQGVHVRDVTLKAYRDLSHMECLTALCGSRTSKYSSTIAGEIVNLVAKGEGWV
ncbi:alpha/beta-hydrolase [Cystobasidium minutum MCA 4210]|uniref:alpha/beta-hydrolase n=1 Tax=Cystobasidium minutum MCA 4210 TaxID=1397322 RepID=UPI0034CFA0E6|eukprot:jgi/Rhomi1/172614/fgenesh1_kg.5_\